MSISIYDNSIGILIVSILNTLIHCWEFILYIVFLSLSMGCGRMVTCIGCCSRASTASWRSLSQLRWVLSTGRPCNWVFRKSFPPSIKEAALGWCRKGWDQWIPMVVWTEALWTGKFNSSENQVLYLPSWRKSIVISLLGMVAGSPEDDTCTGLWVMVL